MPSNSPLSKIRLKHIAGFDSLRFWAASLIVFCHIELVKYYRGVPALVSQAVIYETGKLAVAAFFALSGFLITLLLLHEKEQSGTIAIRNFYMRRILKIWPLYYLMVLLLFFVLPRFDFFSLPLQTEELQRYFVIKLLACLLLMPQMLLVKFGAIPGGEQLWTIGVEEIFYFIWPLLLIKTRRVLLLAFVIIAGFVVAKSALYYFSGKAPWLSHPDFVYRLYLVLYYNRIDCLLLGAVGAILVHYKNTRWLKLASGKAQIVAAVFCAGCVFVYGLAIAPVDYFFYSLAFTWLVSCLATKQLAELPKPVDLTERLGKFTYGIYLWHFIIVLAVFTLFTQFFPAQSGVSNLLLYLATYALTYLTAMLSYRFLESPFLRLKQKFRK